MTYYSIIYMVMIISVTVSAMLAAAFYLIDRNAGRSDKHN